ncbi:MFS transporter [Sphingopyxis sp. MSC1_008]|jgi:DHA1 family tetracycline resistance protein-like MFS transporter|uniref:MFS transporter n=1 Tax=Sphingopyxis sp. MSC1_008 TaxID=2909265 RepID=UPI0020BEBED5|nr:MFS transporter [Sphingopyxis sp. MSC1_008]
MIAETFPTGSADAPGKIDWRDVLPVFVIVSLYAACTGATLPIMPFFLKSMGGTPLILGVVIGAEALCQFVAAPFFGQLSDRLGRKRVLLLLQVGALMSMALLALAPTIIFVMIARMLFGLTAASFTVSAAYVADHSAATNRRQAIGILMGGVGLGGVVGPGMSGYLADFSLTAPIYAAMALSAISIAVTLVYVKGGIAASTGGGTEAAETGPRISFKSILSAPLIRVLVLVLLCYFFAYGMYSSQLAIYLNATFGDAFGPRELSYILAADGTINILVQLFLLKWAGRFFTERQLIVLICGIVGTGYLTIGLATTLPVFAFAILCVSFGDAMARPTYFAALSVHVPQNRQGIIMGTTQSLIAVTDIVSPVMAGLILGQALYGLWIGTIVAFVAAAAVLAWLRLPRTDPETVQSTALLEEAAERST